VQAMILVKEFYFFKYYKITFVESIPFFTGMSRSIKIKLKHRQHWFSSNRYFTFSIASTPLSAVSLVIKFLLN